MQIFVINLEKDKERRDSIQSQFDKIHCSFEFISGVYGKTIPEQELTHIYAKNQTFRNLCRELTKSEIGCALSHITIYKKIVTEDIPYALILEDDVVLPESLPKILMQIENYINPNKPYLILLSEANVYNSFCQNLSNFGIYKFKSGFYTSSYIITNLGAKILIKDLFPIKDVADCWERIKRNKILNIFVVKPALITQNQKQFGSSTTTDIQLHTAKRRKDVLRYKICRLFWITVNSITSIYNRIFHPYKDFYKHKA